MNRFIVEVTGCTKHFVWLQILVIKFFLIGSFLVCVSAVFAQSNDSLRMSNVVDSMILKGRDLVQQKKYQESFEYFNEASSLRFQAPATEDPDL